MSQLSSEFQGLGAAFFPEHHPRSTWKEYVDLMGEAGISFVRFGEFVWDKLEPEEGRFDFDWVDEVFSLLARYGIKVILCTPTAVPPLWACHKYPEIHPILKDGKTFGFGIRRYTCPTSIAYQDLCEKVITAQAKHYGQSEQVLGWQLDNEIGHPFCFCPRCLHHFQDWCKDRFETIENFNDSHVTHFLGQTMRHFYEIPFPNTYPHPSLWMSYHKFVSEKNIECFGEHVRILKALGVKVPITTNMMPTWYGYDHEEMAKHLDVICGDHYPMGSIFGKSYPGEAFVSAYLRGMKDGENIWYHEMQCGSTGVMPLPGQVRWWTLAHVGMGADVINYFRWDTCPSGMERDGYGLLKPCRQPGRIFNEVKQLASDLKKVKPHLDKTQVKPAEVALLYTYENHYEFAEQEKHPQFAGGAGNGYALHLSKHYRAIVKNHVPVDIIYPDDDFSKYRFILAPGLYILPDNLGERINQYIQQGGQFLLTCFSGLADENARIWDKPIPGPVRNTFGIRVLDYGAYFDKMGDLYFQTNLVSLPFPTFKLNQWVDEIQPDEGTEVLATYTGDSFSKVPVFTRKQEGKGAAYYLGTFLEEEDYRQFYQVLMSSLKFQPLLELPDGIYVSCREKPGTKLYFISNESRESKTFDLKHAYENAVTGEKVSGTVQLAEFEVMILLDKG